LNSKALAISVRKTKELKEFRPEIVSHTSV
jgi:hypothetical protein